MNTRNEQKVDVLLAALEERYTSLHNIRSRVESSGTWIIGLSLGAGGWLLQSDASITCLQKMVLTAGVFAAFVVFRYFYLADLRRGFCAQQRVAAKIETALGLFSPGEFGIEDTIYPAKWKSAGTAKSDGKFFNATYLLLYVATAFLIFSIIVSGSLASIS
jgi:hypothetical protein